MLILLCGKSGTGKTSVVKELEKTYKYERIVTYTTRPMRMNEKEGEPYHFVSKEEFGDMCIDNEFIEYSNFVTGMYGTLWNDVINAENKIKILVVEPNGLQAIARHLPEEEYRVVYLYCSDLTAKIRQLSRGDDILEVALRSERDTVTFQPMILKEFVSLEVNTEYLSVKAVACKIDEYIKHCEEGFRFDEGNYTISENDVEIIPFVNSDTIDFHVRDLLAGNIKMVEQEEIENNGGGK